MPMEGKYRARTNQFINSQEQGSALTAVKHDRDLRLWQRRRGKQLYGRRFRRQHPYGDYVLDFVCLEAKLVVEVHGVSTLSNYKRYQVAMPI